MSIETTTEPTFALRGRNPVGYPRMPRSSCCDMAIVAIGAGDTRYRHVLDDDHAVELMADQTVRFACRECNQSLAPPSTPAGT